MVFYQTEPFGFQADMLGHGTVASAVYNVNRKKGTKPYKPEDFVPKPEEQSENALDFVVMLNAMYGGEDRRKK